MNLSVSSARFRLAAFWIAVFAHALGANSVGAYALMQSSNGVAEHMLGFLFLWLGMTVMPALALAPLVGTLASSKYRWSILVLATVIGLVAIGWSSYEEYRFGQTFWIGCIAALAFESAFFSACRFALLPEAARKAWVSLPQLVGLFVSATCVGTGLGMAIGMLQSNVGKPGLAVPLRYGFLGYGITLVMLLLSYFPVETPVRVNDGLVKPFLRTARAIARSRDGRHSLLALWGLFAIGLAIEQWLMQNDAPYSFFLALLVGILLGSLQPNAFRTRGIVPYAAIGLSVCAIWSYSTENWTPAMFGTAGFIGLMLPSLLTTFTIYQPDKTRGHGAALLHAGCSAIALGFLSFLVLFLRDPPASRPLVGKMVVCLSLVGVVFAWLVFFRPAFEFTFEVLLWPLYRVQAVGPGLHELPWKGPALIIANHAAWFDPLWMSKVLPLPAKPMMTSRFYDLPVLGWYFRKVLDAIRVPDSTARKEAPELEEAIATLDRGECLIVFPEGWLRRKEEQPLRRFGRGVWHILHARPETPVFACWIEGNWESMFSHKGGPPMRGKKIDLWKSIRVSVGSPIKLDPSILNAHMKTRMELMRAVVDARQWLGLPPIDPFKIPDKSTEPEEGDA